MKALISVLIAEPSEIVSEGLQKIIGDFEGFNLLSPVHDITSLDDRLEVIRPDILILNPSLLYSPLRPDVYLTPRQQLAALKKARPVMSVLALVYQYVEPSLLESFEHILDIHTTRSSIISLLHHLDPDNTEQPQPLPHEPTETYELSDRETDVLVLVAKGLSSKEIADMLHISVHTVNSHRKNITTKTGIKSVAGLAVYAMLHNLME